MSQFGRGRFRAFDSIHLDVETAVRFASKIEQMGVADFRKEFR